jgi:hypothetical protein
MRISDLGISEGWSKKYKRSIDCNNPKGFSQRAHCQGRNKNEEVSEGLVKQSVALKVLSNVAARHDNSPFPIKFYDGSIIKVKPSTAQKFLRYYDESEPEKQHWIQNYLKTKKGFLELMQPEFVESIEENFADGKVKGKSRPGRVKRAGASCNGSVTELRAKAKKYSGERGKMYHWCANMKAGKK